MTTQYDDYMTFKEKKVRCKVMPCPIKIEGYIADRGWISMWPAKTQFGCKTFTRAYDRHKYWLYQVENQTDKAKELGLTGIRVHVGDSIISVFGGPKS